MLLLKLEEDIGMNYKNSLLLFISLFCLLSCSGSSENGEQESERDINKEIAEKQNEVTELNKELVKTKDKTSCRNLLHQIHGLTQEIVNLQAEARTGEKVHISILFRDDCTDTGYSPPSS